MNGINENRNEELFSGMMDLAKMNTLQNGIN